MGRRPRYRLERATRRRRRRRWVPVLLVFGTAFLVWLCWRPLRERVLPTQPRRQPESLEVRKQTLSPSSGSTTQPGLEPQAPPPEPRQAQKPLPPQSSLPAVVAFSQDLTPVSYTGPFPRAVSNVFEVQLVLARERFCPGSLDGLMGSQTRAALKAYQRRHNLPDSSNLDAGTIARLALTRAPYAAYNVSTNDLARLQTVSRTWLGKSQQTALEYETLLELLAERSHSHPRLLRRLNPSLEWGNVGPGTVVYVPDVSEPSEEPRAALIRISLANRSLQVLDAATNLLAHFPCSIAKDAAKRPAGELHITVIIPEPNYTFDPEVFPESEEGRELKRKLVVPPGPNNPVGRAWIGLDKPGYGIHGTPSPEQVGRTESHGCFRLANWNAVYLARVTWVGMPVLIE